MPAPSLALAAVIGVGKAGDNQLLGQVFAVEHDARHDAAGILAPQRLAELDPLGILDGLHHDVPGLLGQLCLGLALGAGGVGF